MTNQQIIDLVDAQKKSIDALREVLQKIIEGITFLQWGAGILNDEIKKWIQEQDRAYDQTPN